MGTYTKKGYSCKFYIARKGKSDTSLLASTEVAFLLNAHSSSKSEKLCAKCNPLRCVWFTLYKYIVTRLDKNNPLGVHILSTILVCYVTRFFFSISIDFMLLFI